MPPQLTEVWGGTYLQVLIVLLVFALGIPALILQIAVPENIRRIILDRMKRTWWHLSWRRLIIALSIASLVFVWFLHPCSNGFLPTWKSYIAAIIISIVLFLTIQFWWRMFLLGMPVREMAVRIMRRDLSGTYSKRWLLDEKILDDLTHLGEQGTSGYEKELVIDSFDHLTEYVQNSERYRGVELEDLIRGFETILTDKENQGSNRNFCLVCNILKRIQDNIKDRGLSSLTDASLTLQTLGRLGVFAIETKSESTALTFLEAVASDNNVLFQMGLSALRARRSHIATAALTKLEALAEQTPLLTPIKTVHLFGLLSHFWTAGSSTRLRAKSFLFRMQGFFSPSLAECLKLAIEYHYNITNFDTADALVVMLEDIKKGNLSII